MKEINTYIKKVRLKIGKTQAEFGSLLWPGIDQKLVRNRIAKYEIGKAIPPGNIILRIQELEKSTAERSNKSQEQSESAQRA